MCNNKIINYAKVYLTNMDDIRKKLLNPNYSLEVLVKELFKGLKVFDDMPLDFMDDNYIVLGAYLGVGTDSQIFNADRAFVCHNRIVDIQGKNANDYYILPPRAINSLSYTDDAVYVRFPVLDILNHLDLAYIFNHFLKEANKTHFLEKKNGRIIGTDNLTDKDIQSLLIKNNELQIYNKEIKHKLVG